MKTAGAADLRGGGSFSARLTAGLVAAGSLSRSILPPDWKIVAEIGALGGLEG
ncbi:MAG: chorismate synthase, partial [Myxococcota bacterium]|nr:chorismate synthase [Myxococcota bacterium]